MIQRRRWYTGLMKNTWDYKDMFSPKYGDLGLFVLPIAWISIFFSVYAIGYLLFSLLSNLKDEILFLIKINFDFSNIFSINSYIIERGLFQFFTNAVIIFFIFFLITTGIYIKFATKKVGRVPGMPFAIFLYFIFFAPLFGFWWIISIFYVAFGKEVSWR